MVDPVAKNRLDHVNILLLKADPMCHCIEPSTHFRALNPTVPVAPKPPF